MHCDLFESNLLTYCRHLPVLYELARRMQDDSLTDIGTVSALCPIMCHDNMKHVPMNCTIEEIAAQT